MNLFTNIYISYMSYISTSLVSTSWNFFCWDFGSALQTMCAKVGDSRAVLGRLDGSKWSDPTSESCESKQTLKHEILSSLLGMSNGFFLKIFASVFS